MVNGKIKGDLLKRLYTMNTRCCRCIESHFRAQGILALPFKHCLQPGMHMKFLQQKMSDCSRHRASPESTHWKKFCSTQATPTESFKNCNHISINRKLLRSYCCFTVFYCNSSEDIAGWNFVYDDSGSSSGVVDITRRFLIRYKQVAPPAAIAAPVKAATELPFIK